MKGLAFLRFLAGCLVPIASAQEEEHVGSFRRLFPLGANRQQLRRCWRSSQFFRSIGK